MTKNEKLLVGSNIVLLIIIFVMLIVPSIVIPANRIERAEIKEESIIYVPTDKITKTIVDNALKSGEIEDYDYNNFPDDLKDKLNVYENMNINVDGPEIINKENYFNNVRK